MYLNSEINYLGLGKKVPSEIRDNLEESWHGCSDNETGRNQSGVLVPPAGIEPAAHGLGIHCSIH